MNYSFQIESEMVQVRNSLIAELQRAKHTRKALLVRKMCNPSRQENLVMTSLYERPSPVQTLGEGEGHLNVSCDFGCSQ